MAIHKGKNWLLEVQNERKRQHGKRKKPLRRRSPVKKSAAKGVIVQVQGLKLKQKRPKIGQWHKIIQIDPSMYEEQNLGSTEPHICKEFGCGRHLGLMERLFGGYCRKHIND